MGNMIGDIFQGIGASIQGIGQMVMAHANVKVAKVNAQAQAKAALDALNFLKWSPVEQKTDLYSRTNNTTPIIIAMAVIAFVIMVIVIFSSLSGNKIKVGTNVA